RAVIKVMASDVVVRGFEVIGGADGIMVDCSTVPHRNVKIRDNIVHGMKNIDSNFGIGIIAWGACTAITIGNNTVSDCDRQGIYVGYSSPMGTTQCAIVDNTIHDNGQSTQGHFDNAAPFGIEIHIADRTEVRDNHVYAHLKSSNVKTDGVGIRVWGDRNMISGNDIHGNDKGIFVYSGNNLAINGNTIYKNRDGVVFSSWGGVANADKNTYCLNTSYALVNKRPGVAISAEKSWWGATGGPDANLTGAQKTSGLVDTTGYLKTPPLAGPCHLP
ncbi:MAG: right-handed parallel beta-helix repeat-containing protein, partial [Deltaproteobacteria bacterium]|nr:right-handed parallel beta-helix repeat-containing protein [Deltaproteobacteria bacterium]